VETRRRIVPLVYLALLVILGVPGNILIMFVYIVKFQRKTKHRMFVVSTLSPRSCNLIPDKMLSGHANITVTQTIPMIDSNT
jgi:hypothetical protein